MHKNKPFLKWAGGKQRILADLKRRFTKGKRFIDPFLGGGSVVLNVNFKKIIASDSNKDLVWTYKKLKRYGYKFIHDCEKLFTSENNSSGAYERLKDEFNATDDKYRKSLLFIYLNRHCFNGLCRYNKKGFFNVPFGSYNNPNFPGKEMEQALNRLENVDIYLKDFRSTLQTVKRNDVVYCDPPYLPLTSTAYFSKYSKEDFGLKEHLILARTARRLANKGASVIISNHYNWYTKELYGVMYDARIYTLDVSRTISSNTSKREHVKELIAVFN